MTDVMAHGVKLTETAVSKVKHLLQAEGRDDLRLRVAVQPGGCSGLMRTQFRSRVSPSTIQMPVVLAPAATPLAK
jgi:Fe-S cluster assembly iron-binding protein IscA